MAVFIEFVVFASIAAIAIIFLIIRNVQLKRLETEAEEDATEARQETEQAKLQLQSETSRIYQEAQTKVSELQKLFDQQSDALKQEALRVREHYVNEARRVQATANTKLTELRERLQSLQKYESLSNEEEEVRRRLQEALNDATAVRSEANALKQSALAAGAAERSSAQQRARQIHEQADARLEQAIRDAGRIIAEAEKRAQQIGGDAYEALKDQRRLEQAAHAMRNIIDGYGDRYLVPTHTLLDDLAVEYGYDAAGQSLSSARDQSRRMVEQGQAATCDYAEANRRSTAIQFVIDAFNGRVDAILSRTKADNYGVLEQRIRDHFAIVNHAGSAFRNARILPEYLDARLAELKWAVVVQELAARDREEQRYLKEQERDRQKAEQERQRQLREAEKEEEIKRAALVEAEARLAQDYSEKLAQEVQRMKDEAAAATQRKLTIAQQTDKGRIYVISNIGSFGDGIYKIGLTRRQAQERVDELGGASVPFEFDIHAEIETENAPALEYKIHQQFLHARMNKVNLRKEFFRVTLSEIRAMVENLEQGKDFRNVTWTERARAQQYYDTRDIDGDPVKKDNWLKRAKLLAERRRREPVAISSPDEDGEGDGEIDTMADVVPSDPVPPEAAAVQEMGS